MNDRELAAEFVLGEIDEQRRAEVERRLRTEPQLRAEVEAMRAMTGRLAQLPEQAWPAPAPAPTPAPQTRQARVWGWRPAVALASLLVAMAIGVGIGELLAGGGGPGPEPVAIQLQPLQTGSAAHASVRMPGPGTMVLDVADLPPAGRGHYYELWLMSSASRTVPVASFSVDSSGHAELRVPLPAAPAAYRYFDISRQSAAGGTGHSGESVLRGPTA